MKTRRVGLGVSDAIMQCLVGAVGIELKATLKARKLLIPLNAKDVKNGEYARVRYTAGTRTGTNRAAHVKYV